MNRKHKNFGDLRLCTRCGELRGLDEFGSDARMWDKLAVYCKECNRERGRAVYQKKRAVAQELAKLAKAMERIDKDEASKGKEKP